MVRLFVVAVALAAMSSDVRTASSPRPWHSGARITGLPADFIANHGQWTAPVKFAARRGDVGIALEPRAIRVHLGRQASLAFTFEGASTAPGIAGEQKRPGKSRRIASTAIAFSHVF